MSGSVDTILRPARPDDADWVAGLHADSWRRHYRGAYADAYLDGDLLGERLALWRARLANPPPMAVTLIAERSGERVGFVHAILDEDDRWGTLIDNLHVRHEYHRNGTGRLLLAGTATTVAACRPGSPLYLWVLEQNTAATAFYAALGGTVGDPEPVAGPGADPSRFTTSARKRRVTWPDAGALAAANPPAAWR